MYVCLYNRFLVEFELCALLDFILRRHACGWRMLVNMVGVCACVCFGDQINPAHFLSLCSFVVLHFRWLWCRGVSADARRLSLVTCCVCLSDCFCCVCVCVCLFDQITPAHFLSLCRLVVLHFRWLWCRGVIVDARILPLVTGLVSLVRARDLICVICFWLLSASHTCALFVSVLFVSHVPWFWCKCGHCRSVLVGVSPVFAS